MRSLLLCASLLLAACTSTTPASSGVPAVAPLPAWQSPEGRDDVRLGQIVELASGRVLSPAQLIEELQAAPLLLIGEQHDNPDHHALQLWVLEQLAQRRRGGALLLEMLNPDQQARVEAAQAALRRGEQPALPEALAWQPGWDWAQYAALVDWGLRQPQPLLAANLDQDEILALYRARTLPTGARSNQPAVHEALLAQLRQSHCGLLPESQLPAMLAVQQQRDRRMAERLLAAPQPAVLLAGGFHVRRDLGVPLHLADLGEERARVLMLAEVGRSPQASEADYVWFTPAQPAVDHCAALRESRAAHPERS